MESERYAAKRLFAWKSFLMIACILFCLFGQIKVSDECPQVPTNDVCDTSTLIESLPFRTEGNNERASIEGSDGSATLCYLVQETSQTVWYQVSLQTTGTTCIKAELSSDFYPSVLAVYSSGGSCQDLSCLAQSYYYPVVWKAMEGETYYVVVANDFMGSDNIGGPFTLEMWVSCQQRDSSLGKVFGDLDWSF